MGKRKSYIKKRTGGNLFVSAAPAGAPAPPAAPPAPAAAPAEAAPGVSGLIGKFNDLAAKSKEALGNSETKLKATHEKLSKGVNDAIEEQKKKFNEARNSVGKLVSGADVPEPSPQVAKPGIFGAKPAAAPAAGGRRRRKTRRTRKAKKSKKGRKSMKRRHTKRRR